MAISRKILVYWDDLTGIEDLWSKLTERGYDVTIANTVFEIDQLIDERDFDILAIEITQMSRQSIFHTTRLAELTSSIGVILITDTNNLAVTFELMNMGASFYIKQPVFIDEMLLAIQYTLEKQAVAIEKKLIEV